MRIALFATASRLGLLALQELAAHGLVVAVVQWRPRNRGLRASLLSIAGVRRLSPLEWAARRRRIPVIINTDFNSSMVAEQLHAVRTDLICIAIFPRLIPSEIIASASLGAINVHPSLLPRHRGPLPLFWTYHADDRVAGATVHHVNQSFDAGDVILQDSFPLPRGYPAAQLNEDVARRGASLLRSAVEALAGGQAPRVAQDEGAATYAPRVRPCTPMVRFDEWDVERVWHFLAGLSPRFREPLIDEHGRPVRYEAVTGFERGPSGTFGNVETIGDGWKLHCRGGLVLLGRGGLPARRERSVRWFDGQAGVALF
jgi:methionyl-tRNA formyltransferase